MALERRCTLPRASNRVRLADFNTGNISSITTLVRCCQWCYEAPSAEEMGLSGGEKSCSGGRTLYIRCLSMVLSTAIRKGYIVNTASCPPRFPLPEILPVIHELRPWFRCNLRFALWLLPAICASPHTEYTTRCTPSSSVIYNNWQRKLVT